MLKATTGVPHGRVEKAMRKQDKFNCPECPGKTYADQNAADTCAHYLLLRPKEAAPAGSGLPDALSRHCAAGSAAWPLRRSRYGQYLQALLQEKVF
jgi:hypothetical protein